MCTRRFSGFFSSHCTHGFCGYLGDTYLCYNCVRRENKVVRKWKNCVCFALDHMLLWHDGCCLFHAKLKLKLPEVQNCNQRVRPKEGYFNPQTTEKKMQCVCNQHCGCWSVVLKHQVISICNAVCLAYSMCCAWPASYKKYCLYSCFSVNKSLTYRGLVMPYGDINLSQHWFR